MSDRFKFRIWDKEFNKKLYENEKCEVDISGFLIIHFSDLAWLDSFHESKLILMQCTGIKDSKGNLIYESDIVTCAGYGGKVKALVTYDEEKGCFKTGNHKESKIPRLLNKTCTVIGNLYENPEILESLE